MISPASNSGSVLRTTSVTWNVEPGPSTLSKRRIRQPMRQRPTDVSDAEIAHALREVWALEGADPRYVAVGGGSHHWRVEGQAWLRVDDLDDKAFLGATPDAAFASLQQALDTAPRPSREWAGIRRGTRPNARRSQPVQAEPTLWPGPVSASGGPLTEPTQFVLVDVLARMHQTSVASARIFDVHLAHRAELDPG